MEEFTGKERNRGDEKVLVLTMKGNIVVTSSLKNYNDQELKSAVHKFYRECWRMKTQGSWTLEDFFKDRPRSLELFHHIRGLIESIGPVEIEVMKTQVSFGTKKKFAWVWLPQMWTKMRPDDCITLTFNIGRKIDDPRIAEAVEPSPGRWTHHVIIETASDLDKSVRDWLREAYTLSQTRRPARKRLG